MANRKQSFVIFLLIGTLLLGVVGTAFAVIVTDSDKAKQTSEIEDLYKCRSAVATSTKPIAAPEKPKVIKARVKSLSFTDIKVGTGDAVEPGACIVVHYQGSLANNGIVFDSSYATGQPLTIDLDQVIAGWQQGVPGMRVGGIRRLVIPGELGYGKTGSQDGSIGPNQPLVFVVEVVDIKE